MFRLILDELLVTTHGALAALFLDFEGETVELVCDRDLSDHNLRILGAYQGLFLMQLRTLCANADAGEPQRFDRAGISRLDSIDEDLLGRMRSHRAWRVISELKLDELASTRVLPIFARYDERDLALLAEM